MRRGADDISAERLRQVAEERWSHEHDDRYTHHELPRAALAYVAAGVGLVIGVDVRMQNGEFYPVDPWPWPPEWDKRPAVGAGYEERRRALVKAGALIAAEIDRMDREEKRRRLAEQVERDHLAEGHIDARPSPERCTCNIHPDQECMVHCTACEACGQWVIEDGVATCRNCVGAKDERCSAGM